MNLDYAVDRLYESGWHPAFGEQEYETLADGRRFPAVAQIVREFEREGLRLTIKHNAEFNAYRATWAPIPSRSEAEDSDGRHGTVIGTSEMEAAVYALAHLRELRGVRIPAMA